MSLIDQVTRVFQRGRRERRTTASGLEDATSLPLGMAPEISGNGNRLAAYAEVERLDAECAEASAALDTIASLISAAPEGEEIPFRVEWEGNPPAEAREAVEGVVRRAHLGPKTFAFARDAAKYGDNFLEVVLNDALEVERLKHLPARQIYREEGVHGELLAPAFTQRLYPGGTPVVSFRPWQVVHLRWGHRGEERYGRSHLGVACGIWKRLHPLEESMRIARLERGYDKLVHYVEIPLEASLEEAQKRLDDYRRRMGSRVVFNAETGCYELHRQTPGVRTDFYVPVSRGENGAITGGDIKLLAADNAQLAHIDDVRYLHRQLLCALRVPAAFLGFEEDVNARATLAEQHAEFARTIRRGQAILAAGYRQVFDLQLALKGLDPRSLSYRIVWPEARPEEARASAEAAYYRARAERISAG